MSSAEQLLFAKIDRERLLDFRSRRKAEWGEDAYAAKVHAIAQVIRAFAGSGSLQSAAESVAGQMIDQAETDEQAGAVFEACLLAWADCIADKEPTP